MKKFVNFLTCFIFILLLTGISANNIFAFSSGPPDEKTGSPVDGGDTCNSSGCHNTYVLNSGTLDFSISAPSDYTLGEVEHITISFNNTNSGMAMFGFELSALDADGNHVGEFSSIDGKTQTNVSTDYIKHTLEGHDFMGIVASWDVQWTAPSTGVTGPVTFYAAGNECSGDGSPADDYIYTTTTSISAAGASVDPTPDIKANSSDGPVTILEGDDLTIEVSLDVGSHGGENADWWVYVTASFGTYWYTLDSGWMSSTTSKRVFGGGLFDLSSYSLPSLDLPEGDYVFYFGVDGNKDNVQDKTYEDSVSVTVSGGISFEDDILPLFSSTDGAGAWHNYTNNGETYGPATACGVCHAGEFEDDDGEESCPPGCHGMDLNSHEGWLAGMDGGMMTILGESSVGATDYKWDMSMLKMRLRNNRMPPGMPFMIDEGNRDGGIVALTADCGADDIDLGRQFCVTRSTTTDEDGEEVLEVVYSAKDVDTDFDAIGLLSAYVDGLSGAPTTYAGSTLSVAFADVEGLFSQPNVWYNGGLACINCHYCAEEPPCFHEIDFTTQAGLLAGMDGGMMTLLGESSVGEIDYDWDGSSLRARLRNSRMPPNSPFDVNELTRDGAMVIHPITGAEVRAVDLIKEWVEAGAKDN